MKLPIDYSLTSHIFFNKCQKITDVKFLMLHSNTRNYFTISKKEK